MLWPMSSTLYGVVRTCIDKGHCVKVKVIRSWEGFRCFTPENNCLIPNVNYALADLNLLDIGEEWEVLLCNNISFGIEIGSAFSTVYRLFDRVPQKKWKHLQ